MVRAASRTRPHARRRCDLRARSGTAARVRATWRPARLASSPLNPARRAPLGVLAVGRPLALAPREALAAELRLELGAVARALLAVAVGKRLGLLHCGLLERAGNVGEPSWGRKAQRVCWQAPEAPCRIPWSGSRTSI